MAANYNRVKPIDTVAYRAGRSLTVACPCGHRVRMVIGEIARRHGLPGEMHLYSLVDRLTCSRCGRKDPSIHV